MGANSSRIAEIYKELGMDSAKENTMRNLSTELIIDAESEVSTLSEEVIKFGVIFKSIRSGFKKTSKLISKVFIYLSFFRINAAHSGQFERSLIVCENKAILSYIEGCTAPKKNKKQSSCCGSRTIY